MQSPSSSNVASLPVVPETPEQAALHKAFQESRKQPQPHQPAMSPDEFATEKSRRAAMAQSHDAVVNG